MLRSLIRWLDACLRRWRGVFEFSCDPWCVLRLGLGKAPRSLKLAGIEITAGERVLEPHLWNEHLSALPPTGPTLAWGHHLGRVFVHSLRALAREFGHDARFRDVRALVGYTALLSSEHPGGIQLMQRLGFEVRPYHSPLGRFGLFWENLYAWWLMWAFNQVSLRQRRFLHLLRVELWMPTRVLLEHYGHQAEGKPPSTTNTAPCTYPNRSLANAIATRATSSG